MTTAAGTTAAAPAPTVTAFPTVPQACRGDQFTFWYGLTGFNGGVVQQVINKFNQSQTKYYVEAFSSRTTTTLSTSSIPAWPVASCPTWCRSTTSAPSA